MNYAPARGLRGDYQPQHGDLTGRTYLRQQEEKDIREKAIKETVNAMRDGTPLVMVNIPGSVTYVIPRAVIRYLQVDKR
jgi:hypothetical protein